MHTDAIGSKRSYAIVLRIVFDLGELQQLHHRRNVVAKPAAQALLERNPHPTEQEIRWAISGNLCRCTGYQNIVKAVQYAANKMA